VARSEPAVSARVSGDGALVGFDTATGDTAVCATRGDEILHESLLGLSEKGGPLHTTALLGEVEGAVAAAGGWEAVDAIAVGLGPGSFTGLRVGIATARALGLSRGLPVTGVCTLDALGRALGERAAGSTRLAVIDARRDEVFAALYAAGGERLWDPFVCLPAELAERIGGLEEPPLSAGSGAVRFRQALASRGVEVPDSADPVHRVGARHICALAASGFGGEGHGPVAPIYLRPPDAERWRERDTSQAAD
jgi:tRNA threonylcarbamoyladenosine biosynthesis protein TsaB